MLRIKGARVPRAPVRSSPPPPPPPPPPLPPPPPPPLPPPPPPPEPPPEAVQAEASNSVEPPPSPPPPRASPPGHVKQGRPSPSSPSTRKGSRNSTSHATTPAVHAHSAHAAVPKGVRPPGAIPGFDPEALASLRSKSGAAVVLLLLLVLAWCHRCIYRILHGRCSACNRCLGYGTVAHTASAVEALDRVKSAEVAQAAAAPSGT
jgi:hypothetical protein